jgi:glycosyltransferase involved in cell wall biosynthesis
VIAIAHEDTVGGGTQLRILQVSTRDVAGGAERSARDLAGAYRAMGHESWLAVGDQREDAPYTFRIPNDEHRNIAVRAIDGLRGDRGRRVQSVRGLGRATSLLRRIAEPSRALAVELGHEDFDFPGTAHLLELTPSKPDILHLHNLHGGYFDLRALPELSRLVPTILNVRDAWLTSGHCAFSLDCEKWKTGCGGCPDLTLFPAVKRDATSSNWNRKRAILASSRVYVAAPSEWMMVRVRESIIAPAAVDSRVIPNGTDTRTFRPGDRAAARATIGIAADARVLLVAANGLRDNVWKDYATLRASLELLGGDRSPAPTIVLAVGEVAPAERIGSMELRFVPFQSSSERLAEYYRAADVYLHAARVESFGNVLLEARACGTPTVSTGVGGIVEQVRALDCPWLPRGLKPHEASRATGVLVREADPRAFAAAVRLLLQDAPLRATLAANGMRSVHDEFGLGLQAERFIAWYREILAREREPRTRHAVV